MKRKLPKILKPAKIGQVNPKIIKMAVKKVCGNRPYVMEGELTEKIEELLSEYSGIISTVAALGILDLIKSNIINNAK